MDGKTFFFDLSNLTQKVKAYLLVLIITFQVRGFFRGMAFPLGAVGFLNSIFFGVYGNSLRMFSEEGQDPTYRAILMSGGLAGAVQAVPACPIELVKVKLQTQQGKSLVNKPKLFYLFNVFLHH